MNTKQKLYEGKAKILYKTADPEVLLQYFKDDATAFDGVKKGTIIGKGVANNTISSNLFRLLREQGIDSHFVDKISDNEMLVKNVDIVPVELVVRNISTGSLCRRYGINEGIVFGEPIVELYYKDDELHDPLMNDDHVLAMELASREELAVMKDQALRVNAILREFFDSIGINLVDFKLEFGRFHGQILLADEISPDTCRFWEKGSMRKLDKDRFRQDLGDVEKTYTEMMQRIAEKIS
ncbi:phosphoribosylaminoimidazolesuccinocarboxamide synthase [bacterium]|nr:phosphoribosylaminoimidazolesuccinocarboxamide synthase [bacterium]MBU1633858.1 phosphoribosylaminoimidazolesuccinocarboxamide synthase [bacterium]MBU1872945.1 phosphoribosylaminoimidazolesuccinocarboxamide synthase [bacterium]